MSIAKPTLSNPWGSSTPANLANPGAVNETGMGVGAKSIPRRWLNWVLNKIENPIRYLVARGLPDYDAAESYSVHDKVQQGGTTWSCIADVSGVSPSDPTGATYWSRWGFSLAEFGTVFASAFATAFAAAFPTAFAAAFAPAAGALTVPPAAGEIVSSVGTVSEMSMLDISGAGAGPGLKVLKCKISDCGTPSGYFSVTLSGTAAVYGAVLGWVQGSTDISRTLTPICTQPAANVIVIDYGNPGFVIGPHPTIYLLILGITP